MEFHFLPFCVLFCIVISGNASQAPVPAVMYWQSVLPNTSMPKALHDLIQPETAQENTSTFSEVEFTSLQADYGIGYINKESLVKSTIASNITTVYFLHDDLHPGQKMMLVFAKSSNESNFVSRKIAQTIPFSSNRFLEILKHFSIELASRKAQIIKRTIKECEASGVKGEDKYCATSLESLVDFIVAKYGNKVEAYANEVEEENKKQNYTFLKGIKMIGDDQIVCHKKRYPYAVFYCHIIMETRAYLVPLMGEDGSKAEAIVVCHMNTSAWNPMHLAFQILKVKPGGPPICHFLNSDTIVWIPS
ncbi:BURP domain protein RD22-like [Mercurialis annua]|uniref:BURP domain protein RD22-like n=1 Tax=Mercurialis annua TaxID=3986 RepID=UPI00215F236C|nr:BURP domain protein RD22-like [Mercurialis annua]